MNAEVRAMKTPAEQALSAAYAAARGTLPGQGVVAALREDAFKRFDARGLPHRRVEEWKYTDLRALMREAAPLAKAPSAEAVAKARAATLGFAAIDAYRAVFVDGHFVAELSSLPVLEDTAIEVKPLREPLTECLRFGGWELEKAPLKGNGVSNPMIDLNTAFVSQGLSIGVWNDPPPGKTVKPVHVAHVRTSREAESAFVRLLVATADDTKLDLIESFDDLSGAAYQTNSVTEVVVGDRAQVRRVVLNRESLAALHVQNVIATLNVGSRFDNFIMTSGGSVTRAQASVTFYGPGAKAFLGGVSLLRGKQHCDNTLVIEHASDRCESREQFRSVLDDESHGVFQGKIVVEPHAQKTDAKMMTRALLLSEEAEADNKPELEIFADDVVCGHGATAGALDPGLKFYLMSRGISEKEAEALLIQAFIGEVVEEIAHEGLREALMSAAVKWLGARG